MYTAKGMVSRLEKYVTCIIGNGENVLVHVSSV